MTVAVDTSALFAILLNEARAAECAEILETSDCAMSAGTHLEAIIVGWRKGGELLRDRVQHLIDETKIRIVDVDTAMSTTAIEAFDRFGVGRGRQPAALTYGDCFSYALSKSRSWPLLYVGDDFSMTDVASVLPSSGKS